MKTKLIIIAVLAAMALGIGESTLKAESTASCVCTDWRPWEPNNPNTGYYRICGGFPGPANC